jgi:anti-sigma B factor antagonist
MNLHLGTSERDGVMVLSAQGEIDVATAPQLRQEIVEIASAGSGPLVVDLDGVDFLDSTGLGVLVSGLKRFRTLGTDLLLVSTRTRVLRVFEITGLMQVFSISDTVDAAVAAARAGRQP